VLIRMPTKAKLTLSIDRKILNKAKKTADQKHVPLSRAIENFLDFFSNPRVYCIKCGDRFDSSSARLCPKCGWMICPKCKSCRCGLDDSVAVAVFQMRRVYEELLTGRVK
jgi:hypothetical protein